jgi:hypothetical protein
MLLVNTLARVAIGARPRIETVMSPEPFQTIAAVNNPGEVHRYHPPISSVRVFARATSQACPRLASDHVCERVGRRAVCALPQLLLGSLILPRNIEVRIGLASASSWAK